ncbi:methyl-accepting chemotaxis protein [Sphingosinicella sp. BN140058]|uniref:methyl-accepting chemotaxis protein n=1 Tax=Sphingosinicella sp. BN140058 TaxID=1892855 RepID=UPI0010114C1B|nr:methyl-accepting chemotaxis protein [Sphingosinicella sp. BN140058]QAY76630.1 methyl-accepting chemotaxis protein [Sphingosinicella sp. BN140058]
MTQLLKNTKISAKILALLALLGALCLGLALYSNSVLKDADTRYADLVDKKLAGTIRLVRLHRFTAEIRAAGFRAIAYDGGTQESRDNEAWEKRTYADALKALAEARGLRPELDGQLAQTARDLDDIHGATTRAIALGLRNDKVAATNVMRTAKPLFEKMEQALVPMNRKAVADAEATSNTLSEDIEATARTTLIISILGLLASLGAGIFVARNGISGPILRLQETMRALAAGNNAVEVDGTDRGDEVGAMAKAVLVFRDAAIAQEQAAVEKAKADAAQQRVVADLADALGSLAGGDLTVSLKSFPADYRKLEEDFNAAVTELRNALIEISRSTGNIHGGSGEISQASDDLSRRTEQQAASLEETAAAMTQITTTVQNSAAGASEANKVVLATQADAQASSKVVGDAVAAMAEIEKSSQEITKIIAVIDKIAFQTNLLALNASVEAAHAGEAGRAFAVVANEVRALAQRSADAAQEIGTLISNSSRQVEGGVTLVGEAGKALARIIGSVDEVSGLVSQIAMAADQQSSALAQVNTSVTDMDKLTQQNAAMVEESNAAARSLAEEASGLARLVGRFETGARAAPTPVRAPRQAAPAPRVHGNTALALQSSLATAVDDWNAF